MHECIRVVVAAKFALSTLLFGRKNKNARKNWLLPAAALHVIETVGWTYIRQPSEALMGTIILATGRATLELNSRERCCSGFSFEAGCCCCCCCDCCCCCITNGQQPWRARCSLKLSRSLHPAVTCLLCFGRVALRRDSWPKRRRENVVQADFEPRPTQAGPVREKVVYLAVPAEHRRRCNVTKDHTRTNTPCRKKNHNTPYSSRP